MTNINADFESLNHIISFRRTRKPDKMNGQKISREWIEKILQLADKAPTHGRTEPWRFFVLEGEHFTKFCKHHAQMYWDNTPVEKRKEYKFEKLSRISERASHLIIVMMHRSSDSKIPMLEEYAATAASIQNLLLGAETLGMAAIWSTGGMAYSDQMKTYLKLNSEDRVVGFIYLGFTDEKGEIATRKISLSEKIKWL